MSWTWLALLAGMTLAVVNINDKYVVSNLVKRPVVPLMFFGFLAIISAIIVYFISGFGSLSTSNILLGLIGGVVYAGMTLFYFYGIKDSEVSAAIPLFQSSPVFIAIFAAMFLGEHFSFIKYVAIGLIVMSAYLIGYKKGERFKFSKSFWFMIFAAICCAISQVITKYLVGFTDYWTVFSYLRIGSFLAIIPLVFIYKNDLVYAAKDNGLKSFSLMTMSEILNLTAVALMTAAAVTGYVTLTNALSSVQPLFVLVFAILISIFYPKILKEEIGRDAIVIKVIAIILMITGAILVI
ncbi:MAG: DMT family transporter [Candidatus Berkelbacteria bacterium]|nr:DMT family transporter [Candidatus Berkelbacteria bacterium]